jgi:hypothetical protein
MLTSKDLPNVRRYYTTCTCMLPSLYDEYLRVIHEALKNDNICYFDETLFSEIPTDFVALVIKNYGTKGGLSEYITRKMRQKAPKESDLVSLN